MTHRRRSRPGALRNGAAFKDCYCRPAGARAASAEGRYIPREDREHVTNAHCIADVDDKV
jgi:hypothetical protein